MKLLRAIFFPVVPFYYGITWLRNKLYDVGIFKSVSYDFPVICVGNLSVGGTGKTPMIEYLIRLLKDDFKVATLSRGYKRKSTGFLVGKPGVSSDDLGDEPFQFYTKFNKEVTVAVDANRSAGIANLKELESAPEVILLDDAFQHRKVNAGFNILLTTFSNLYTSDFVLPTGNLREPKQGAKRADIIVVTKCPEDLSATKKQRIVSEIRPKPSQIVVFSSIIYSNEVVSKSKTLALESLEHFTLVTGIANPKPLVDYLNEKQLKFEHLSFKDHHDFSADEVANLSKQELILTTEKDYMRLMQFPQLEDKLFYLSIEVKIDQASAFDKEVLRFVNSF